MYLYVRIDAWDRNSYFDKKTKKAPVTGRRRKHGRGHPRQSPAWRARWGTTSKQHTEWWTSSRATAGRLRSKPGLNLTSQLLRRQVKISVHVYNKSSPGRVQRTAWSGRADHPEVGFVLPFTCEADITVALHTSILQKVEKLQLWVRPFEWLKLNFASCVVHQTRSYKMVFVD